MTSQFDEFRRMFTSVFTLAEAKEFNTRLLQFVTDQRVRPFIRCLRDMCDTADKEKLVPVITSILPHNMQMSFSNAWMLAKEGKLSDDTEAQVGLSPKDVRSSYDVLYLGSGGLPHVPEQHNPIDVQLLNSVLQALLEGDAAAQPARMHITSDSIRVVDDACDDVLNQLTLDYIVYCHPMGLATGGQTDVLVVVQQDPIYEIVVAHFFNIAASDAETVVVAVLGENAVLAQARQASANPFVAQHEQGKDHQHQQHDILAEHELDRDRLHHTRGLGAGQFGMVYLATFDDDTLGTVDVAVKMLRAESEQSDEREFQHEAEVMLQLDHPNIVRILGVCMNDSPWLLVLEYMPYGNLRSFLQSCLERKLQLTAREHLTCCRQLASALEYVHAQGFVHMDIAARNVLLGHNMLVKLADFGQARPKDSNGEFVLQTVMRLSVRWMAPETLANFRKVFSECTDIWAYAVTCWEIFMYGRLPFKSLTTEVARDMIREGKARLVSRPPTTCPKDMWALLSQCWDYDPFKRPTFVQMKEEITALEQQRQHQECRDLGQLLSSM
ncbi:TK/HMTK protein kinase [Salpingoeca rosetta]|uniref:TK/HMTK protein kinase n=1 Tax=Salpingoeca rosetta (strain ATCC 50818 / BSB-021) TaxID=946362 RepID=F2U1A8_SALR5|nr:TK/HMTK protein kinase [Salpingoeca rosetta]EGD81410.1 TK/HMTK protein kinase [Salpingoeca rosetta]|eukprot:XP_004996614.1 TK/HMTK protein kinase [Salpingoeca rosetta]